MKIFLILILFSSHLTATIRVKEKTMPLEFELLLESLQTNKEFHQSLIIDDIQKIDKSYPFMSKAQALSLTKTTLYQTLLEGHTIPSLSFIEIATLNNLEKKFLGQKQKYSSFSQWFIHGILSDLQKINKSELYTKENVEGLRVNSKATMIQRKLKSLFYFTEWLYKDPSVFEQNLYPLLLKSLKKIAHTLSLFATFSPENKSNSQNIFIITKEELPSQKDLPAYDLDARSETKEKEAKKLMDSLSSDNQ